MTKVQINQAERALLAELQKALESSDRPLRLSISEIARRSGVSRASAYRSPTFMNLYKETYGSQPPKQTNFATVENRDEEIYALEAECERLRGKNRNLQEQIESLQDEIQTLRSLILANIRETD